MDMREPPQTILMEGRDHLQWGRYAIRELDRSAACFMSVGSDSHSPACVFKGDRRFPNEDALLLVHQEGRFLVAVADARFGLESSHGLLRGLADRLDEIPASHAALTDRLVNAFDRWRHDPELAYDGCRSATTLVVAVYDRARRQGFGLSVGDSTFAVVGGDLSPVAVNPINSRCLSLTTQPGSVASLSAPFTFATQPGQLLLAFTDGVNECHYRYPETSITPRHMQVLFHDAGFDPREYARALGRLAMDGVSGSPGGQDNIALVVVAA